MVLDATRKRLIDNLDRLRERHGWVSLYSVSAEQEGLAKRVIARINELQRQEPPSQGYEAARREGLPEQDIFSRILLKYITCSDLLAETPLRERERLYFLGTSSDNILAYVRGSEQGPGPDIALLSNLKGWRVDCLRKIIGPVIDEGKSAVSSSELKKRPGYSDYTGSGKVFTLVSLEDFREGGFRSRLLTKVQREYELIEAEAGPEEVDIFVANGFANTGLQTEGGEYKVFTYHNPKYKRK